MRDHVSNGASSTFIALLVVAIIIVSGVVTILVYSTLATTTTKKTSTSASSSTLTTPTYVTVFGLVSTTGTGTHAVAMVFTSMHTATPFVAPVTGGRFSIQLPNHDIYNVATKWAGNYTSQVGQTERGRLPINFSAGSTDAMSYNVVESTPGLGDFD